MLEIMYICVMESIKQRIKQRWWWLSSFCWWVPNEVRCGCACKGSGGVWEGVVWWWGKTHGMLNNGWLDSAYYVSFRLLWLEMGLGKLFEWGGGVRGRKGYFKKMKFEVHLNEYEYFCCCFVLLLMVSWCHLQIMWVRLLVWVQWMCAAGGWWQ